MAAGASSAASGVAARDAPGRAGTPVRSTGVSDKDDRRFALLAVTPAMLLVTLFMLVPIAGALVLSFFKTDGVTGSFVGLSNYVGLFTDPLVGTVFLVNLQFLIAVPLVLVTATLCGVMLHEKVLGWRLFRVVFFIPSVLSTAVIGLMFKSTFAYDGPVNKLITAAGGMPVSFFSTATLGIAVIILALVWSGFGYGSLIVLAGLSAIEPEVYEAASLDGAGWWQRLWYITLPQIRQVLMFVSVINVIYTFTSLFGFVYVMTAGGPGYSTTTLDYLIYQKAFSSADMGSGSALAIVVFALIGILTYLQRLVTREKADVDG
jgi:ABC-type sugar transport system permease subunit